MSNLITLEQIKERLDYDPKSGVFIWKDSQGGNCREGWPAGRPGVGRNLGYIRITVNKQDYRAHRLAWLFMTGQWPVDQIDHKNGNTSDNRFENLRECTQSQNKANSKVYKNSKSGIKGVSWRASAGKWVAVISIDKKQRFLGYFENIGEAAAAYRKAAQEHFGAFART